MSKITNRPIGESFVAIPWSVFDSEAYNSLGDLAQCLLNLMIRWANRRTGRVTLGCRRAAEHRRVSKSTASRALCEIERSGLASVVQKGSYLANRPDRQKVSTTWRLNFAPFNNGKDNTDDRETAAPARRRIYGIDQGSRSRLPYRGQAD